jgi:putative redox protein
MLGDTVTFPGSGGSLVGRLQRPAGPPRAYALFAHCFTCSKDLQAASRIAGALAERGIAVLRFDFTGLGESEGEFDHTTFSSNVADLVAAADWLRQTHQAPRILIGHSLGGAAVLSAAPQIEESVAVATIGAPADPGHVRQLLAEVTPEIEARGEAEVVLAGRKFTIQQQFLHDLERQDLATQVGQLGRALAVFHSPQDTIVGIENAAQLFQAAKHPKSFVSLDGADHLLKRPADAAYVGSVVAAWAERYLPADAPPPPTTHGSVVVRGGASGFATVVSASGHHLVADEPTTIPGGTDTGPSPYDLLLAGLGACTSMTLRMYADHKQWPLEGVEVRLQHSKIHARDCADCETEQGRVDVIERELVVEGPLDETQRQRLLEIADRCPVHRTLSSELKIRTELGA